MFLCYLLRVFPSFCEDCTRSEGSTSQRDKYVVKRSVIFVLRGMVAVCVASYKYSILYLLPPAAALSRCKAPGPARETLVKVLCWKAKAEINTRYIIQQAQAGSTCEDDTSLTFTPSMAWDVITKPLDFPRISRDLVLGVLVGLMTNPS